MSQKDISSRFSGHDWHLEYTGNDCTADIHCKSWNGFLDLSGSAKHTNYITIRNHKKL